MGLEEKRHIKEYQEKTVPERRRELAEICGSEITYDVDWGSFTDDLEALKWLDNLAFHRINMAFRMVCKDELGKDAVNEGLDTIRLRNVKAKDDMRISFADGVLEMHCAYGLRLEGIYQENEIGKVVSQGL